MRALVNDGATASRQEPPCTTPDELAKAVAAMPRIRPPEPAFTSPPEYQRTTYQQGAYGRPAPRPGPAATQTVAAPPPPLQSRTGRVLKWTVAALLIAALGLGSWQIADKLIGRDKDPVDPGTSQSNSGEKNTEDKSGKPVDITGARDFDPLGDQSEKPDGIKNSFDGNPSTFWTTDGYKGTGDFGHLKSGVGIILDLGKVQQVGTVDVSFLGGDTSVELRAAAEDASSEPTTLDGFTKVADGSGSNVSLKPGKPVQARYVLVWLTNLPQSDEGNFRGKVSEIKITS